MGGGGWSNAKKIQSKALYKQRKNKSCTADVIKNIVQGERKYLAAQPSHGKTISCQKKKKKKNCQISNGPSLRSLHGSCYEVEKDNCKLNLLVDIYYLKKDIQYNYIWQNKIP